MFSKAETDILVRHNDETRSVILRRVIRVINILLWASGVGVVATGTYMNVDLYYANNLLRLPISFTCSLLLIVSGAVVVLFSLLTCFAHLFKKRLVLFTFIYLVTLVFVLQCIVAALGFTWRTEIKMFVEKELAQFVSNGSNSETRLIALGNIQSRFQCCGAMNYTDWKKSSWMGKEGTLPFTCCKSTVKVVDCTIEKPGNLHQQGCALPITERYEMNFLIMAVIAVLVAFFQFICYHLTSYIMFHLE